MEPGQTLAYNESHLSLHRRDGGEKEDLSMLLHSFRKEKIAMYQNE